VYALIEAPNSGWLSFTTIGAFVAAVVVLGLFVAWERRVHDPMLDLSYFRNPAFSIGSAGMILVFLGMYGVMFLLTQYFQLVLGLSALSAALRVLPMSPIMLIVSPRTPKMSERWGGHRVVTAGMALVAIGFAMFGALTTNTTYLYVFGALLLFVIGISLTMGPMTASIMSAVPPRRAGAGSATNDATRELGAALGIAVLGSLAASRYDSRLGHVTDHLTLAQRVQARSSLADALSVAKALPRAQSIAVTHGARVAFVDGIHVACITGAVLSALAGLLVWRRLPRNLPSEEEVFDALPEPVLAD
jgi:Na+/melibiose symporter-like transporter